MVNTYFVLDMGQIIFSFNYTNIALAYINLWRCLNEPPSSVYNQGQKLYGQLLKIALYLTPQAMYNQFHNYKYCICLYKLTEVSE